MSFTCPFSPQLSSSMSTAFYHLFVLWSSHFFLSEVRLMNFVFGPSSEHLRRVWYKVSPFMQIHVCCSVAKLRPTLGDPMDCSISGFPVLPYLLKFAQTHVHWVGDTTQPSHSRLTSSPPLNLSHVFQKESALHIRWPTHWSFSFSISLSNEYWELISFRIDWFDLLAVHGTRVFSSTIIRKPILWPLSLLYGPTLISVHNY